ncbi:MAG: tRNA (adenosine(37)-N6)-threonylcarbamoyltransferase complex dimerization subunit type 1 TsaB [Giesbergeria sp.]|jgi:tRNA threonylcarbamoyladenosine biosynthesis protein TsaB|nr:tRNA (adenosine(37)-N6)-threonylcarbamoyltransferase complex dimerization subunit type 1 TsaB [Giesbergeria sp.]MBP6158705.1 tRNA (adenosine(37)-N6)-threonylcarbamoyltransferase complex dimerization subunit type 1 TsaB [Giesbergeria sp.]MBP7083016.1 tRNA (adenosine(37)-N6)-threonylcarbamoyltransferase complex dimerization subunit type 1 TsaB [Giesbergeria sp.]MBP9783363.1 tRNA (adenosine(37)-N6)-threonylcarbamoyltransferase complex dimerization subunit type 1 TsaB [Giesbergeria sp.]MBP989478
MKLLAFDTSTESLSIAAQHGERVINHSGAGGAQASAGLIPALRQVLAEAALPLDALDALVFGRGPGSFTGVRTACSVAQGLAFGARGGAGLPVLPVDSLLAVAEDARHRHGCTQVVAVLDARMNEVYVARYAYDAGQWSASGDCSVCAPEAVAVPNGWTVAGNAQAVYGARLAPHAPHVQARPEAAALLRLAPALLAQGLALAADAALPLYVRNKVAQTTAERAAKAAQTGATAP